MYLKQIKIYGFKSFADKIEIDLCPNINGIVGPNGSGKSNIIDAVRWVLGEQSIKSLRGEVGTDVIFSGSKSRKPLNSAYVCLIFDNTDKSMMVDYNEVSIKRVAYRTGESEYFLNNEKCRLKDIYEILTETGASRESFNIISQGKIDEILMSKPQDRRVIFESAANVLKYKKRKEEAIRKLERTNDNIERVSDIISELETNLGPLEKQSNDAKRYLEDREKLKEIEISLIAHDINSLTYKIKEEETNLNKTNDEIVSLSSNTSSYDIELLKNKEKLKDIEDKIAINQTRLVEITKKIETIDADIRVLKERKKYTKDSNQIESNVVALKEEALKKQDKYNQLKNEIQLKNKEKEDIETKLRSLEEKLVSIKGNKNKLETNLSKNNRMLTDLNYKIKMLEDNINNNNSMPNSIKSILNNPRFSFVHNTIGKLIKVDSKYSLCLETALGASLNYLVVNTSDNAKELVEYLKDNNLGRATFYPLDVIKERYIDGNTLQILKTTPVFIDSLDNLVEFDNKYSSVIRNQLGNVVVVKNIGDANYISKLINHKYKVVTLDGQVVNVGGSVTGGSKLKSNNIIKEKYEIEENIKNVNNIKRENKEIINRLDELEKEISVKEEEIYNIKVVKNEINLSINSKKEEYNNIENDLVKLNNEVKDLNSISNLTVEEEETNLLNEYYKEKALKDNIMTLINELKIDKESVTFNIEEIENLAKKSNSYIQSKEKVVRDLELRLNTMNLKVDNLLLNLSEEYNMTFENAKEKYKLEIDEAVARGEVAKLKSSLRSIGSVNIGAIEEYERVKTRYDFLDQQRGDLKNALDTLLEIIKEMDEVMTEKFLQTFESVRVEFKKVFREMFGGGDAELILTDPDNPLETGIEIKAVPSGKTLKSLSLLSGGEKTFTAISLLFAILNIRPVPFCLLDEVEAALDDANVESFCKYLNKYRDLTQFILITHKKKTMEYTNTLYGITMQESGVSKLVSVKLEDIKNKEEKITTS